MPTLAVPDPAVPVARNRSEAGALPSDEPRPHRRRRRRRRGPLLSAARAALAGGLRNCPDLTRPPPGTPHAENVWSDGVQVEDGVRKAEGVEGSDAGRSGRQLT